MSGNPEKELASHGIKLGTLPFLAKPFEGNDLIAIVQHVLEQPVPTLAIKQLARAVNDPAWYG
jgi:FixJ family two-component response regulator